MSRPQLAALVLVLSALVAAPRSASSPIAADLAAALPRDGLLVFGCEEGCGESAGLYTIAPDGRRLRFLKESEGAYEPRWSPDGRAIAFTREIPPGSLEPDSRRIWISRSDGSGARILARPSGGAGDSSPAWSPRGDRLAFVRSRPQPGGALHTIDVGEHRSRPLLQGKEPFYDPDWSPDGKRIAGWRSENVTERLWVVGVDGSDRRRLGPATLTGRIPRWSPDGSRVAFIDFDEGALRVLDLPRGRVRTLFSESGEDFGWAHTWSPDGRWLAVARTTLFECDDPTSQCEKTELWIVNATDSRKKLVFSSDTIQIDGIDWRRRS